MEAIKRPHFLAKPVFVPFIPMDDAFSLAGDFAAQVGKCQTGRFAPQPTEFVDTMCHNSGQFCKDYENELSN